MEMGAATLGAVLRAGTAAVMVMGAVVGMGVGIFAVQAVEKEADGPCIIVRADVHAEAGIGQNVQCQNEHTCHISHHFSHLCKCREY